MDISRALIREPAETDARSYRRRVVQLAVIYFLVFTASVTGLTLLVVSRRLLVLLAARSNVETLTIAFFALFFGYLATLSARGAAGALRLASYHARARLGRDPLRVERAKAAALGRPGPGPAVALNLALDREDQPGAPFEIEVADDAGPVGRIRVDGVVVRHVDAHAEGSNTMLSFFVRQVAEVLGLDPEELDVVSWKAIDAEGWHEYVGLVRSLDALGRAAANPTSSAWPRRTLSAGQCRELARRMSAICAALRDEAFLPRLEYEGEHKIPIIPEPLGIISLQRKERRVDPLSSMTSCLVIVAIVVGLLLWFIWRPPWLPPSGG